MERLNQFDILKALGILLVIAGHTIKGSLVCNFIYSFHMPLFFLVSGYFLKEKYPLPFKQLTIRLLKPYISTCILLVLLSWGIQIGLNNNLNKNLLFNWILSVAYGNGISNTIDNISLQSIGALWFLLALFWGTLIVQISLHVNKKCPAILTITLCVILSMYLSGHQILLPFSIRQGMLAAGYVYIGYITKKYYPTIILQSKISWIPLSIIWIMSIKSGFLSILQGYANPELVTLLGALCGTYFMYLLSTWLAKFNTTAISLSEIGKLTLLILCVHAIEDLLVPWQEIISQIPFNSDIVQIVISIIRIFIILGIVHIIKRIPYIQKIFNI